MSAESEWIKKEDISKILEDIDNLPAPKKIALRRCCGKLLKEASAEATMAFYQVYSLPKKFDWARDRLFAVICMYCFCVAKDKNENQEKKKTIIPFKKALCKKREQLERNDFDGWSGVERRLLRLLDRRWDGDGILCTDLWRMIKQMKNEEYMKGYAIDMASLGWDLCSWNADNRKVQQEWLRVCYQKDKEEEQNVN